MSNCIDINTKRKAELLTIKLACNSGLRVADPESCDAVNTELDTLGITITGECFCPGSPAAEFR